MRDSYLDHIDYGLVDPNAHATAPDQIAFGVTPLHVGHLYPAQRLHGAELAGRAVLPVLPDQHLVRHTAQSAVVLLHRPTHLHHRAAVVHHRGQPRAGGLVRVVPVVPGHR
jgi:hypothetical protein